MRLKGRWAKLLFNDTQDVALLHDQEIVAVGPGARDDHGHIHALDLKAGDRILFGKWSGSEVKIDGEDLLIMKESDILGVLDPVIAQAKAA